MKHLCERPRYRGARDTTGNLERIIKMFEFEKENQGYVALGPDDVVTVLDILLLYDEQHNRLKLRKEGAE